MTVPFSSLCLSKKIVIFVGEGGVGKTTLAAAAALSGARSGRHVACLTIDPARRLADCLGLADLRSATDIVDATSRLEGSGYPVSGSLGIGMLDARATFDELVRQRAKTAQHAERILHNRLYRYVSSSLSGIQEYMALERLAQLRADPCRDLIILDTPPSANTIDFFSAPGRMKEALDGPLVRVMRRLSKSQARAGFDLAGRWAHAMLGILARVAGAQLLDEIMDFVDALSDLFGDFFVHASSLETILNSSEVAIVMVTRPGEAALNDCLRFRNALSSLGFSIHGLVVNQMHFPEIIEPPPSAISESERLRINDINADWNRLHVRECNAIGGLLSSWPQIDRVCGVPSLPEQAASVANLARIMESMFEISREDARFHR